MSKNSNALIQMLLSAETEAAAIVKVARENRVKKLKEARDSAEEEICIMRQKEEELFQKKLKERHTGEDTTFATLNQATDKEIALFKKNYEKNHTKAVTLLSDSVLSVNLDLEKAQLRQITSQMPLAK